MNLSVLRNIAATAFVTAACLSLPTLRASAQSNQGTEIADRVSDGNASDTDRPKEEPLTSDQARELVSAAIKSFYEGIVTNDTATRLKALKSLQPTEKHIAALLGQKHGAVGLQVIKPRIEAMIAHVDEVSAQLGRGGRFQRCELEELKIPTRIEQRALSDLMGNVGPETFRFKALIHTEKSRSSSSSYYVINRDVVYIEDRELIQVARRINTNR